MHTRVALAAGLTAVCLTVPAHGATVYVPSQQPTIQAGIDAAGDGGTVYVAPSIYTGPGNRVLDFGGANVTLESTGGAASTVIDCGGSYRGFYFHTGEDTTCVIEGFTVRNCDGDYGGAVRCQGASPTFRNCVFTSNEASSGGGVLHADSSSGPRLEACVLTGNSANVFGGALYMEGSTGRVRNCSFDANTSGNWGGAVHLKSIAETTFEDCDFRGNTATWGGAVYSVDAESAFERCTFVANEATWGGGVYIQTSYNQPRFKRCTFVDNGGGTIYCMDGYPIITQSILALDRTRSAVSCVGIGEPEISHCYVFGNAGGDSLCGSHANNAFEDPLLCGVPLGDVGLCDNSPCLPGLNPWGEHIGALMDGCGACNSPVNYTSWGLLKASYARPSSL
ncbi:MAG: right-handed parallel beta-helix repeat-containing protein [Candidatus Eisenbacteria bacterium]